MNNKAEVTNITTDNSAVIAGLNKRIAELEEEISTALDLLPIINDAQYLFYNKHRHLLRD